MANYLIDQIFLKCASHTLCGIKPANMFTVSSEKFSEECFEKWKRTFQEQGLSVVAFDCQTNLKMIFAYDFAWERKILGDIFVQAYLKGKGFSCPKNTSDTLQELFFRLATNDSFPHEVGVFLGYPIEDVIQFEECQGKCCRYCGYWKSYCNPEEAKKCHDRFRICSLMCKQWFEEGYSIPQIIKKYKEVASQAA